MCNGLDVTVLSKRVGRATDSDSICLLSGTVDIESNREKWHMDEDSHQKV